MLHNTMNNIGKISSYFLPFTKVYGRGVDSLCVYYIGPSCIWAVTLWSPEKSLFHTTQTLSQSFGESTSRQEVIEGLTRAHREGTRFPLRAIDHQYRASFYNEFTLKEDVGHSTVCLSNWDAFCKAFQAWTVELMDKSSCDFPKTLTLPLYAMLAELKPYYTRHF
jgi:hypothetical protein